MPRKPHPKYRIERCTTTHANEAQALASGKWVAVVGTAGTSAYVNGWLDCFDALYGGPEGWYRAVDQDGNTLRAMKARSAPSV
jgi:hypothetical protein